MKKSKPMRRTHRKHTKKHRKSKTLRKRQSYRQRGGAFSIESISPENEHETIVTIRPDSREEDSIPMTMRLTTARRLLEDTDTHA